MGVAEPKCDWIESVMPNKTEKLEIGGAMGVNDDDDDDKEFLVPRHAKWGQRQEAPPSFSGSAYTKCI